MIDPSTHKQNDTSARIRRGLPPPWSLLPVVAALTLGCGDQGSQPTGGAGVSKKGETSMTTPTTGQKHKHTNHLIHATSPYLLQHAHNPVDWYEWGPEALERAKREDKPIFLSIGYSACHWCHVMERESFENEAIAKVMNEHFICIKVDREERPDLDDIYMAATQAFTRQGGWPMSVWLTPDQRPFYAGTYFPPESRNNRPGFLDVLTFLSRAWREDREKVLLQAEALKNAVVRLTRVVPGEDPVASDVVMHAAESLSGAFDPVRGGMGGGGQNKFPPSMAMDVMLRAYHASLGGDAAPKKRLLDLVELTLEKMAHGGIYDHLGGGFARYSTDANWLVPHFEKMLYDQALLSDIYLKAFQLTGKLLYARIARETLNYVIRDLQSPEGGFYSTRDADSEGEEGKFYVWSRQEVEAILGPQEAALFCDYYDVSEPGNWEGHNILNVPRSVETVAKLHKISPGALRTRLAASRVKLLAAREKRVKPHLDDKVLSGWNGLMIASMAKAYRILGDARYRDSAEKAARFVMTRMRDKNGRLLRAFRAGKAHTLGFLDDHAFMIEALLNLYETTFDVRWLRDAEQLNDVLMKHYRDTAEGGFFFTADDAEKTLVRAKNANDGAIPSGSSVQLMNLQRLAVLLDRKDLAAEAETMLRTFGTKMEQGPFSSERMLCAVDFYYRRPKEIAFVCKSGDTAGADRLINAAWRKYIPNVVFAMRWEGGTDAAAGVKRLPLLAGKKTIDGKPTAYVCENYTCKTPTTDPKVMLEQVGP